MAQRVTSEKLNAFLSGGSHRVTSLKASTYLTRAEPLRVTSLRTDIFLTRAEPVRVSTLQVRGWVSLAQAIKLGEPFGSNEVYTPADVSQKATYTAPPPPVIEVNPYRADVPNVDQQRILREQHNLIQAGDSTFHWGVLTEVYASANYTLGSLGRFFHDDLGMIHARFVKFTKLTQGAAAGFPVGLDLASKSKWVVTNQFDRSSPDWIVGIALPYNQLAFEGDCFGWVIVDGFVPVELEVENDSTDFLFGTEYGWASTGKVHVNSGGDSLGTRRTTSQVPNLRVGEFYVEVKDLSLARLQGIISAAQAPLSSQIDSLTTKVNQLSTRLDSTNQNLSALTTQVSNLDSRVTREVENINNSLAAIRRLMPDGDYKSYVDSKIEGLRNDLGQQIGLVSQVSNDALLRANEAYALAQSISYEGIQVQIDALNDSMGGITDRLIGFTAVIDTNALAAGQILVATGAGLTPGGQPLLTWNPVDPTLELMKDIDWSTPPTDGQVIAWDDSAGEFKFVDQSGGGGGGDSSRVLLAEVELSVAGSLIDFTSISQSFKNLEILGQTRINSGAATGVFMRFNGDSGSNYSTYYENRFGNATYSNEVRLGGSFLSSGTAGLFSVWKAEVWGYSRTDRFKGINAYDVLLNDNIAERSGGFWRSNSAITSIDIYNTGSANFAPGSWVRLYGLE